MTEKTGKRVAFQGERGAYSEMAALAALGDTIEPLPRRTFDDVFASVESSESDMGLVPIENSLAGSIHRNYDLLLRHQLHIVGETQFRVEHCLIANPGGKLADMKIVRSHPQALSQCEHQLAELKLETEVAYDTAGSVRELRDSGALDAAALASRLAAEIYGMTVLREGMEDDKHNFTRFLMLSRTPLEPAGECKTSIVFALQNKPGALFGAMACFALRDVDLTKIESRPIPGSVWEYHFYLDFHRQPTARTRPAGLEPTGRNDHRIAVLGTYPREV